MDKGCKCSMEVSRKQRPYRNSRGAPRFSAEENRDALELFLDDFSRFVAPFGLTSQEMVKECVLYTDEACRRLWRCLDEYKDGSEWQEFTKAVLELYPSTDRLDYSVQAFQQLVRTFQEPDMVSGSVTGRIESLKGFLEYHRQALPYTEVWISLNMLSGMKAREHYFSVFTGDLKDRILHKLAIMEPKVHPDDPYPIPAVRRAAVAVLQNDRYQVFPRSSKPSGLSVTSSTSLSEQHCANPKISSRVPAIGESVSLSAASIQPAKQEFIRSFAQPVRIMSQTATGVSGRVHPAPAPVRSCFYCREAGHRRSACKALQEDWASGLIVYSSTGSITASDGSDIPVKRSMSLRDRVRALRTSVTSRIQPSSRSAQSAASVSTLRSTAGPETTRTPRTNLRDTYGAPPGNPRFLR